MKRGPGALERDRARRGEGREVISYSLKESELFFPNIAKSQSNEINSKSCQMALKVDRRFRSDTAETPVKFWSHPKILNTNLAASRLDKLLENELTLLQ